MLFQKSIIGNSQAAAAQWEDVRVGRAMANQADLAHVNAMRSAGLDTRHLATNDGVVPRDVYQEFDRVTIERFRSDDGDTFLNDLLPLSRSVNIGRLVHKFRRASDAGNAQTSMTGQIGVKMDQVEYNYDGAIIPVHDTGFSRNWREWNAQRAEGFDALIDDQRESVATLRRHLADNFLDGHTDRDGNLIVVDGVSWAGMRNDARVEQVDLGAGGINFDFTDNTATGDEIKAAFIQLRDVLWIDNNCSKDITFYVSKEIASNFERKFSTQYDAKTIQQELQNLMGVAAIKVTSKMSGNELMGFPLDSGSVRPVVGMGLNTVAMPRPVYNSNYEFVVWGAIGFQVVTDYTNQTCALYASE